MKFVVVFIISIFSYCCNAVCSAGSNENIQNFIDANQVKPEAKAAPEAKATPEAKAAPEAKATLLPANQEKIDHLFWPNSLVYHFSFGESLSGLIKDFCSMQDVNVVISDKLMGAKEKVNRTFQNIYAVDAWDQISKAYGLLWFYDGSVLYVYSSGEIESQVLQVHPSQVDTVLNVVEQLGLYGSRISLKSLKEGGIVLASGPPKFVQMLNDLSQKMFFAQQMGVQDNDVRVFKLKHAWATDRKLGELKIEGVATLLKNILGGGGVRSNEAASTNKDSMPRIDSMSGVLGKFKDLDGGLEQNNDNVVENEIKTHESAFITTDVRQNAIIVKDSKRSMPLYEKLIKKLDVSLELIEIRAAIVEVDSSIGMSKGNNFLSIKTRSGQKEIKISPLGNGENSKDDWSVRADLNGVVNGAQFMSAIKFLETSNAAKVLARPSVITMDNMEAIMSRNETFYESVKSAKVAEMFPITSGTTLKVTPHIVNQDGKKPKIQLLLDIKDGSASEKSNTNLSKTKDSSILTQALVYEGQSILIGGYFREKQSKGKAGIPFLKDIPLLGNLFKNKSKSKQVFERLFLITPTIVKLSAEEPNSYQDYFKRVKSGHSVIDELSEKNIHPRSP